MAKRLNIDCGLHVNQQWWGFPVCWRLDSSQLEIPQCEYRALLQGIKLIFPLVEFTIYSTAGNKSMMTFSFVFGGIWLSLQYEHRVILQGINRWWGFPVSSRYGRGGVGGLDAANACEQFSPGINYDYLTYNISCLFYYSNYPGYDGKATETYWLHI